MKKLKLAKPWRMRVVRQNLSDLRMCGGTEDAIFVPCLGPRGTEEIAHFIQSSPRTPNANIRCVSNHGPQSGAIFALDNPRTP